MALDTSIIRSHEAALAAPSWTAIVKGWLKRSIPRGNQLSEESWGHRHTAIVYLLWAHVAVLPFVGIFTKHGVVHSLMEGALVAVLAYFATVKLFGNPTRSVFATAGLVTASAILTHFFDGLIEMHFHFFVVVAVVALYQSWLPFAFCIGYVLFHHGVMGVIDPDSVFNHVENGNPWQWAAVHAFFIACESLACLTAWRLNEIALETERSTRTALEKANGDLAEAQQLARIGSWEWNLETDAVVWSAEFYRICGVDPETFTPSPETFVERLHPDDRKQMTELIEEIHAGRRTVEVESRVVHPSGAIRVVRIIGTAVRTVNGVIHRMVGTCQDISDQKELEEEIQHKAFHDPLTGLANRSLFLDRLNHSLASRGPRGPIGVIFVDLDDFKAVNDSLGHAAGDELLCGIARLLETQVRASDTIARFGGDEFAVLVERGGGASAVEIAGRIQQALTSPMTLSAGEIAVGASMGVAIADANTTSDELMRDADIAMYAVKMQEKNSFEVCDAIMRSTVLRRLELKSEIEQALVDDEFALNYQPIVDLDTREVIATEALVRWEHPRWGLIAPSDFISLAEESGLIVPLGEWVLRRATKETAELIAETGRDVSISVNLSARQLHEEEIVSVVRHALADSGLPAANLIIEITESILMVNKDSSIAKLRALQALGVKIAIDDFGTGYSSLSYLHQLPIDILKIDRAFVAGVTKGPEEAALAQAVIKIAGVLGLTTISEGIESQGQLDKLIGFGSELGQGHLFSEAVSITELKTWLESAPRAATLLLSELASA